MLSPELLKKVQAIYIRSRRKATDLFSGEYRSAFRGRGIEFEEVREYSPGDDVRLIDWNVSARLERPFIKIFREEREQTIFFLVDVSKSLNFGGEKDKIEVATEVAALLAFAAIKSQDKVGLVMFTDKVERYVPPKKGRGPVWGLISTLLSHKPESRGTNIKEALHFMHSVFKRRAVCFLISDFMDDGYADVLKAAAMRHDIVAIRVRDKLEQEGVAASGLVDVYDAESGSFKKIQLAKLAKILSGAAGEETENLKRFFGTHQIDFLDLKTHGDHVDELLRFFILREKRR